MPAQSVTRNNLTVDHPHQPLDGWHMQGHQCDITLIEFADLLSHNEFWNFGERNYVTGEIVFKPHPLAGVNKHLPMTRIYRHLTKLENINTEFEYTISFGPVGNEDEWWNATFTKQDDDTISIEVH